MPIPDREIWTPTMSGREDRSRADSVAGLDGDVKARHCRVPLSRLASMAVFPALLPGLAPLLAIVSEI